MVVVVGGSGGGGKRLGVLVVVGVEVVLAVTHNYVELDCSII